MDDKELVLAGWYCWRCRDVNLMACRSDCVPIYVPKEWEGEMMEVFDEGIAARPDVD